MEPPAFSLPLPTPSPVEPTHKLPRAAPDFLSTPQGELSFFRSIVYHRLVGPDKHFQALAVARDIRNHSGKHVALEQVWEKYREVYDEDVLETTWADQELTAIDRDGLERSEGGGAFHAVDPPVLDEAELDALEASARPYARAFPPADFSLAPDELAATTAFARGRRTAQDPPDSPADAPLRDVFYDPAEDAQDGAGKGEPDKPEDKKRSHRKRNQTPKAAANAAAAARVASPRRRKTKQVAEEASGSELSDLTDDDEEEDQDEDEDGEGESQEETAGEDAESYLEDGTAASQNGDEDEEEQEEEEPESKTSRKRKAAPGRRAPASTKRTRARSTSVATADSRTAAERKKEQATPSTSRRGRAAGGSGRKPGRPSKKK